jgi:hypothetical protein
LADGDIAMEEIRLGMWIGNAGGGSGVREFGRPKGRWSHILNKVTQRP